MKRRYLSLIVLLCLGSFVRADTAAQPAVNAESAVMVPLPSVSAEASSARPGGQNSAAQTNDSRAVLSSSVQASQWGLTETEWSHYRELMAGQRGIWSPGLDPLTALGVEARTDAERRHFAELAARVEFERVDRELAFERERMAAFKRLYPDVRAVEYNPETRGTDLLQTPGDKRLILFAGRDCQDCSARIAHLAGNLGPAVTLDVYVTGLDNNDDALRQWAKDQDIPVTEVQAGHITLNHENGAMQRLQLGVGLPQVLIRTADGKLSPFRS